MEQVDVVIVGARLAGCAAAAPLARAGRRVVVLDKMGFPSDQLSTHVLLPAGTSELAQLGALPRILALRPSRVRWTHVEAEGVQALERLRPAADGIDFGVCIPRDLQDVQLVEAAREQGADVREHCAVESLLWRAGRVVGVRYRNRDGAEHELASTLVIGADGRRSTTAALVGVWTPYRLSRNGRGLVFRYLDDPLAGQREAETYYQWREGDSFAFAFPTTPVGRLLVLLMGHRDEASEARKDPEGYWERKLGEHPGLARRVAGAPPGGKLRSTGETPAFFRASSGPGWALAGDAGHFKDPVTGQGMRDAMFAGRTLAEQVLPALDDPDAVDRATRAWEAARDRECLPAYHFANADTKVERQSAVICELIRDAGRTTEPDITDLFGRARTPQQIAPLPRLARALGAALWRGERPRLETLRRALPDIRTELAIRSELRADRFRSSGLIAGSEHPDAPWPPAPALAVPTLAARPPAASADPVSERALA
ncbi:MAG TPA: FAD-dependent monooxygenase [Solirubrobacteraceae bacterium]|nr:FAD-dependent monooxygenase [Solirubrobacteraceae bacterium]HME04039.1 FAD-dependent monooxygenase [Solirubrobacteraceae bacterium]